MKHYVEAWKRYTDFKGRSSRAAYWWPFLLTIVISFVLGGISASVFGTASDEAGPLEVIFQLAGSVPVSPLVSGVYTTLVATVGGYSSLSPGWESSCSSSGPVALVIPRQTLGVYHLGTLHLPSLEPTTLR